MLEDLKPPELYIGWDMATGKDEAVVMSVRGGTFHTLTVDDPVQKGGTCKLDDFEDHVEPIPVNPLFGMDLKTAERVTRLAAKVESDDDDDFEKVPPLNLEWEDVQAIIMNPETTDILGALAKSTGLSFDRVCQLFDSRLEYLLKEGAGEKKEAA
jgi:hypothetical protein